MEGIHAVKGTWSLSFNTFTVSATLVRSGPNCTKYCEISEEWSEIPLRKDQRFHKRDNYEFYLTDRNKEKGLQVEETCWNTHRWERARDLWNSEKYFLASVGGESLRIVMRKVWSWAGSISIIWGLVRSAAVQAPAQNLSN